MAQATKKEVFSVLLEMTHEEAQTLAQIMDSIGGLQTSARRFADSIGKALHAANVGVSHHRVAKGSSSIYFED